MDNQKTLKLAKRYIKKEPMPSSLKKEFKNNGLAEFLPDVYQRTAELIRNNEHASKAQMQHLEQILPCIAFYEVLLQKEGSQESALKIYEGWCFHKIEKIAKVIPVAMKIPGLYKKTPAIMKILLNKTFGKAAGFEYCEKQIENGFAADMLVCPYVVTCRKYGCPELAQFFCKSDDIMYGNMHPKLIWGRTKTLGMGAECCDFSLYIEESTNEYSYD